MSFDIIEEDIKHFIESKSEYVQVVGKAYARLWPVVKEQINKNLDGLSASNKRQKIKSL